MIGECQLKQSPYAGAVTSGLQAKIAQSVLVNAPSLDTTQSMQRLTARAESTVGRKALKGQTRMAIRFVKEGIFACLESPAKFAEPVPGEKLSPRIASTDIFVRSLGLRARNARWNENNGGTKSTSSLSAKSLLPTITRCAPRESLLSVRRLSVVGAKQTPSGTASFALKAPTAVAPVNSMLLVAIRSRSGKLSVSARKVAVRLVDWSSNSRKTTSSLFPLVAATMLGTFKGYAGRATPASMLT